MDASEHFGDDDLEDFVAYYADGLPVYFSLCDNDRMIVCGNSGGNKCVTSFVYVMNIWTGDILWYHKKNVRNPTSDLMR